MSNDIISRQAAIDALGEEPPVWYDGEDEIAERDQWRRDVNAIKALPPAQEWIPCSERMPEHDYYGETFQVTIQCEHVDGWDDYVSGYADWTPNGWDIQSYYQGQIKVVAWMLMPEPWKGGQDGEN